MPAGELFINGKDAYTTYGVSLTDGGLSALMTPPPMKELIESTYRKKHGKVVIPKDVKMDSRDINLEMHLTAPDKTTFFSRYSAFCSELAKGVLTINTKYMSGVYFRVIYLSCTQFTEFVQEMAKFTLKLNEPDPSNRGATDKNS